jgi:hypothetical protein
MLKEGLSYDGQTNVVHPFETMSRKFGRAFIDYLEAAWLARDDLSEEEFCRLNGGVTPAFIERRLRCLSTKTPSVGLMISIPNPTTP